MATMFPSWSGQPLKRLRLSVDIYNLFNVDTYTDVRNNSSDTGDADFGQPLALVAPAGPWSASASSSDHCGQGELRLSLPLLR